MSDLTTRTARSTCRRTEFSGSRAYRRNLNGGGYAKNDDTHTKPCNRGKRYSERFLTNMAKKLGPRVSIHNTLNHSQHLDEEKSFSRNEAQAEQRLHEDQIDALTEHTEAYDDDFTYDDDVTNYRAEMAERDDGGFATILTRRTISDEEIAIDEGPDDRNDYDDDDLIHVRGGIGWANDLYATSTPPEEEDDGYDKLLRVPNFIILNTGNPSFWKLQGGR